MSYDVTSGVTSDGVTLYGGKMFVYNGGTANNTTVDSYGSMHVFSGGIANKTKVYYACDFTVSFGGIANSTFLYNGGYLFLSSGGSANNTTVEKNGRFQLYIGGSANSTTIKTSGYVSVFGIANSTTVSGGLLSIYSGGTAIKTTITPGEYGGDMYGRSAGYMYVSSGGTAKDTTVNRGANFYVSGGTARVTTLNGYMGIGNGGTAIETTIIEGSLNVDSGGTANDTMVEWGSMGVGSGGSANDTMVYRFGTLYVSSGGIATDIDWTPCEGHVYVSDGGYVTFASQYSGVYYGFDNQLLSNAAVMDGMTVNSNDELYVMNGGIVNSTMVRGSMYVYSGGIANDTSIDGGILSISRGGITNSTTLNGGNLFVSNGGTANDATVNGGGLHISSGGTANRTAVNFHGRMYISSGGTAIELIENGGCVSIEDGANVVFASHTISGFVLSNTSATIHSGTTANSTTIDSYGNMSIHSGGIMNNTAINSSGKLYVQSGGTANLTAVGWGGYIYLSSGGTANRTTINMGGGITVSDGGMMNTIKVDSKGYLTVNSGGKITGKMTFESGAEVSVYQGGIVDFDLAQAGTGMLVNDLSPIMVKPATYTLTVNGTQSDGTYKLAGGATRFDRTISVMNTAGSKLGTLRVGRTVTIDGVDYTLSLADDVLSVTVEGAAAPAPAYVAKGDRDGNGVSDVMFVWTGEHGEGNYAHGYWMNGSADWWSANAPGVSPDWDNLGSYDMSGDGKADAVMFGNVIVNDTRGAYIGYYQDGNDMDGWVTIGFLDNSENVAWQNKVGNLTGNAAGKNSIVWYAPDLYALGAWTEGTTEWSTLCNTFGGKDWNLVGCGDFDGDGRDSVLMSYNGGQLFYSVDIGGALPQSLGNANWSGWEIRAIGDFAGDGKDDIVLFHEETGSMVLCADGDIDNYKSIGQLAAKDWFVVGAGDYNGDQKDDLLVRQYSTGMLGYYICADQNQWVEMGRGVGMEWTVIA